MFSECAALQTLIFPAGLSGKIDTPLRNSFSIRKVVIPHGVTIVSDIIPSQAAQVLVIIGDNEHGSSLATINTTSTFRGTSRIVLYADTPPVIKSSNVGVPSSFIGFYVPDDAVETYKTAEKWTQYAAKIFPVSEFVE